jgi:V8-like Glu-specific endopeptidase
VGAVARLLTTSFLFSLAVGSMGCSLTRTSQKTPQRPASERAAADEEEVRRFFNPPFQLAVPEDAIVRIVTPETTCTGTILDDDLVLTANHCIAKRSSGKDGYQQMRAEDVRIELGGDYLAWGEVRAKAIVAPPCGFQGGGGDIALLVLSRKVVGLSTMTVRLDTAPKLGEFVDPIGFGRCATNGNAIHRSRREGGHIRAMTGETMVLDASVCPGDSGGPVVVRGTHEVVGVVSLSAMDGDDRTRAPSIMARLDAFRRVFAQGRLIADGMSPAELPPLDCQ